jgi:hypothetical protein
VPCSVEATTSLKRRHTSIGLDGAASQKTVIFIFVAVWTWNLTYFHPTLSSSLPLRMSCGFLPSQHTKPSWLNLSVGFIYLLFI